MKFTHGTSMGSNSDVQFISFRPGILRRRAILGLSAAAAVMAMSQTRSSQAQTSLYWDMNDTAAGSGGPTPTGTWNDTNTNWNTASDGSSASPAAWIPGDVAIFAAGNDAPGQYTVTMGKAETVDGITLQAGSLNLAGGGTGITLADPNSPIISVAGSSTLSVACTLSGMNGFTKSGDGTLNFATGETATGNRLLTGGTTVISSYLNIAVGGTLTLDGGTLIQTASTNGGPFINSGTIGSGTAMNIGPNNGTVNYASSGAGLVSIYGSGTSTFGTIYGTGTLIKAGTLEFRVQGPGMATNTFPKLQVLGGLYRIGHQTDAGGAATDYETGFGAAPSSYLADAITLNGGSIGASFVCTINQNRGITLGAAGGTLTSGLTVPSIITGIGGLNITGADLIRGTNTYQGATNIWSSSTAGITATFQGGKAIPDSSAVILNNSGSNIAGMSLGASETIGSVTGAGNVALASSSVLTTGNDNTSTVLSGVITGTGGLKKIGAGTFTASGTANYTLGTTVAGGTLKLNKNSDAPALNNAAGTDIQKGKLVIDYNGVSNIPALRSSIISALTTGYASGFSSGQIKSTTAGGQFALGYKDDPSGQLFTVAYTRYGDANVDGTIDSSDFGLLAANYGRTVSTSWNGGDFNYDGTVNALDFNALATNYGQPVAQSGDLPAGAAAMASLGSVVPEPATLSLLGIAALGLIGRRRRRA